eukprot:g5263.t1
MQRVVRFVLSRALAEYFDVSLEGSIGSKGRIRYENLAIKANAFDALQLPVPVKLKKGNVGSLTAVVSWKRLQRKRIEIHLENIYVEIEPQTEESGEVLLRKLQDAKLHRLDLEREVLEGEDGEEDDEEGEDDDEEEQEAEEERQDAFSAGAGEDSADGSLKKKRMVENMIVTASNIHLRVIDERNGQTIGITFDSARFHAGRKSFKGMAAYVGVAQDISPNNFLRSTDLEISRAGQIKFLKSLRMCLAGPDIAALQGWKTFLFQSEHSMMRRALRARLRPTAWSPRAYWHYAVSYTLAMRDPTRLSLPRIFGAAACTWPATLRLVRDRARYIELYKRFLGTGAKWLKAFSAKADLPQMHALEERLSLSQIKLFRRFASAELAYEATVFAGKKRSAKWLRLGRKRRRTKDKGDVVMCRTAAQELYEMILEEDSLGASDGKDMSILVPALDASFVGASSQHNVLHISGNDLMISSVGIRGDELSAAAQGLFSMRAEKFLLANGTVVKGLFHVSSQMKEGKPQKVLSMHVRDAQASGAECIVERQFIECMKEFINSWSPLLPSAGASRGSSSSSLTFLDSTIYFPIGPCDGMEAHASSIHVRCNNSPHVCVHISVSGGELRSVAGRGGAAWRDRAVITRGVATEIEIAPNKVKIVPPAPDALSIDLSQSQFALFELFAKVWRETGSGSVALAVEKVRLRGIRVALHQGWGLHFPIADRVIYTCCCRDLTLSLCNRIIAGVAEACITSEPEGERKIFQAAAISFSVKEGNALAVKGMDVNMTFPLISFIHFFIRAHDFDHGGLDIGCKVLFRAPERETQACGTVVAIYKDYSFEIRGDEDEKLHRIVAPSLLSGHRQRRRKLGRPLTVDVELDGYSLSAGAGFAVNGKMLSAKFTRRLPSMAIALSIESGALRCNNDVLVPDFTLNLEQSKVFFDKRIQIRTFCHVPQFHGTSPLNLISKGRGVIEEWTRVIGLHQKGMGEFAGEQILDARIWKKPLEEVFPDNFEHVVVLTVDDVSMLATTGVPLVPMLEVQLSRFVCKWQKEGNVLEMEASTSVHFYDVNTMHFAPFVEPFRWRCRRDDELTLVEVEDDMNINLTFTSLEGFARLSKGGLSNESKLQLEFVLHNDTGLPLEFQQVAGRGKASAWTSVPAEMRSTFFCTPHTPPKLQLRWQDFKQVSLRVDAPGVYTVDDELAVAITSANGAMVIRLASPVRVENSTSLPIQLMLCGGSDRSLELEPILAGHACSLPIHHARHGRLCVRPSSNCSEEPEEAEGAEYSWWPGIEDLRVQQSVELVCHRLGRNQGGKVKWYARVDCFPGPSSTLVRISSVFVATNNLPFALRYSVVASPRGEHTEGILEPEESLHYHSFPSTDALEFGASLAHSNSRLNFASVRRKDVSIRVDDAVLPLDLQLCWDGTSNVRIFSRYTIINETFLPLMVKASASRSSSSSSSSSSSTSTTTTTTTTTTTENEEQRAEVLRHGERLLYSASDRICISTDGSEWSDPFDISNSGIIGMVSCTETQAAAVSRHLSAGLGGGFTSSRISKKSYVVGVQTKPSGLGIKVVFCPRIVIINHCKRSLAFTQAGCHGERGNVAADKYTFEVCLSQGVSSPFHWIDSAGERSISLRPANGGHGWRWSGGIPTDSARTTAIKVHNDISGDNWVCQVTLDLAGACIMCTLREEPEMYRVVNDSLNVLHYRQSGGSIVERLFPGEARAFGWETFSSADDALSIELMPDARTVRIDEVGWQEKDVRVTVDGATKLLIVGGSEDASSKHEGKVNVRAKSVCLCVDWVSVSVGETLSEEMLLVTLAGLGVDFVSGDRKSELRGRLRFAQVDNMLPDAIHPVMMTPMSLPAKTCFLEFSISSFAIPGYAMFPHASFLLQGFRLRLDPSSTASLQRLRDFLEQLRPPTDAKQPAMWYIQVLEMGPMKMELTLYNPDVEKAMLRFNAMVQTDVFARREELVAAIAKHYSRQFRMHILSIIGSSGMFGDPVGLIKGLGMGVADFFYEPAQGLLLGGPKQFGLGLLRGSYSLVAGTVGGTLNTASKMTGNIAHAAAALSLDSDYLKERERQRAMGLKGLRRILQGSKALSKGVLEGVGGVVLQPVAGAKRGGALGLFKGMGKGLLGLVVKPSVGVFDMVSDTTQGIRSAAAMTSGTERMREMTSGTERMREPRIIAPRSPKRKFP